MRNLSMVHVDQSRLGIFDILTYNYAPGTLHAEPLGLASAMGRIGTFSLQGRGFFKKTCLLLASCSPISLIPLTTQQDRFVLQRCHLRHGRCDHRTTRNHAFEYFKRVNWPEPRLATHIGTHVRSTIVSLTK